MTTTSKGYGDYVVFLESHALRGRSKQEYLRQVRKLGEHYAGQELAGVTEREVFDYLVHRREVEKLRPSTLNPTNCTARSPSPSSPLRRARRRPRRRCASTAATTSAGMAAQGPSDPAAAEERGGQGPETRIAQIRRIRARHRQPRGVRKRRTHDTLLSTDPSDLNPLQPRGPSHRRRA